MIVQIGDEVLRQKARPVSIKDFGSPRLKSLIRKMSKALHTAENGVAIAAPQIGASERLFLVAGKVFLGPDSTKDSVAPPDRVFINPEISRLSRAKREMAEGCLSITGKYGTVMRHEKASLRAQDENGKSLVHHASGLLAHIFQHEVDHLEGILYVDKAIELEDDTERDSLREQHPEDDTL